MPQNVLKAPILLSPFHKLSFDTHHAYVQKAEEMASILASMIFSLLVASIMPQNVLKTPILLSPFHKLSFDTHHAYVLTAEKWPYFGLHFQPPFKKNIYGLHNSLWTPNEPPSMFPDTKILF